MGIEKSGFLGINLTFTTEMIGGAKDRSDVRSLPAKTMHTSLSQMTEHAEKADKLINDMTTAGIIIIGSTKRGFSGIGRN